MQSYILSVISAALISGIVVKLLGDHGTVGSIGKMLAGIFLAVTVIRPFMGLSCWNLDKFLKTYQNDAQYYSDQGSKLAAEELQSIIKSKTEAYILDKAKQFDVSVAVHAILNGQNPPQPTQIIIEGNVSPYARQQLTNIIEKDLGIAKENQAWN